MTDYIDYLWYLYRHDEMLNALENKIFVKQYKHIFIYKP
jgi:hypothetical protein